VSWTRAAGVASGGASDTGACPVSGCAFLGRPRRECSLAQEVGFLDVAPRNVAWNTGLEILLLEARPYGRGGASREVAILAANRSN
jgi:hypothetical protein